MWPSEYMLHEHRKDMLRIAAQSRLAREFQADRLSLSALRWLARIVRQIRLRRARRQIETVLLAQPPCPPCPPASLRRVS